MDKSIAEEIGEELKRTPAQVEHIAGVIETIFEWPEQDRAALLDAFNLYFCGRCGTNESCICHYAAAHYDE